MFCYLLTEGEWVRRSAKLIIGVAAVACSGDGSSGPGTIDPPTSSIVLDFCLQSVPVFFAYKNGNDAWTRVLPDANGSFTFMAAPKVGITFIRGREVQTYYTTSEELKEVSGLECHTDGTKMLSGSLANLGPATPAGDPAYAIIAAGTSRANGSGAFTLASVPDGRFDLVGVTYAYASQAIAPTKAIIRRDLLLSSGSTLPVLDFASNEAAPIATHRLTVTGGLSSDFNYIFVDFTTASGTGQNWQDALAERGPLTFHAIPASLLVNGDLHELAFHASTVDFLSDRGAILYFREPSDKSVALGPALNQPTFLKTATTPYVRIRGTLASQAEYGSAVRFHYFEALGGEIGGEREWHVTGTAGYFGGTPATWELEMPDLSAVPGFSSFYSSEASDFVIPEAEALSSLVGLFIGRAPRDGDVVKHAGIQLAKIPGTP
jgi:hypothetical protein